MVANYADAKELSILVVDGLTGYKAGIHPGRRGGAAFVFLVIITSSMAMGGCIVTAWNVKVDSIVVRHKVNSSAGDCQAR